MNIFSFFDSAALKLPIGSVAALLGRFFGSCVRISVDGFDPIYISVSEEALIEFTNELEYLVTND